MNRAVSLEQRERDLAHATSDLAVAGEAWCDARAAGIVPSELDMALTDAIQRVRAAASRLRKTEKRLAARNET